MNAAFETYGYAFIPVWGRWFIICCAILSPSVALVTIFMYFFWDKLVNSMVDDLTV